MAFLFAGIVFATVGGTIIGSILGFAFALVFYVVLPLCFKLAVVLCRGVGSLLTVR